MSILPFKPSPIYSKLFTGLMVSLLTFALTMLSSGFTQQGGELSPFWPVSGIGLAVFLSMGPVYLIFPAMGVFFWYLQLFNSDFIIALMVALLSIVGSLIGGVLFKKKLTQLNNMECSGLVNVYVFGLITMSISSALWALSTKAIGYFADYPTTLVWLTFLMSESLGLLLFFPLFYLVLSGQIRLASRLTLSSSTLIASAILVGLFITANMSEGIISVAALIFTIPTMALYGLNEQKTAQFLGLSVLWAVLCLSLVSSISIITLGEQQIFFLEEMVLMIAVSTITFQLIHFTNLERIQVIGDLKFAAIHDERTGLLNERGFNQALSQTREGASYLSAMLTMVHNDELFANLGYERFNQSVKEIASRMEGAFPVNLSSAIISGSKVAILMELESATQAEKTLQSLHDAVQCSVVNKKSEQFIPEISSGGVYFQGPAPDDLLTHLAAATHFASLQIVQRHYLSAKDDPQLKEHTQSFREFEFYKSLLTQDKLQLWGQIITPVTGYEGPVKVELLARMSDANNQLINPLLFITSFEKYQYQSEFDKTVIIKAMALIKAKLPLKVIFNINITASFFADTGFADFFLFHLNQHQVPPANVAIEITESQAIPDMERTRLNMQKLQTAGVEVGLDDFGTGFAGFSYLMSLPFNFIKLDGEFIKNLPSDTTMQAIVASMGNISRALGTSTVAEYVQDQETVALLSQFGIDYGQGFGLSKPCPFDEVMTRLALA